MPVREVIAPPSPRSRNPPAPPSRNQPPPPPQHHCRDITPQSPYAGGPPPVPPRRRSTPQYDYQQDQQRQQQYQDYQHQQYQQQQYQQQQQQQQQYQQQQYDLESSLPRQSSHPRHPNIHGRSDRYVGSADAVVPPPRNRDYGRIPSSHRLPTAGHKTGTVQKPTGESSNAPTWMREANVNIVPRSKETASHTGWKTDFRNEFKNAHGEMSGAVLDDSAQSGDAPEWMKEQTKNSPRGYVPIHKRTGRNSNDLGVQGYRGISSRAFTGAAGE